MRSSLGAAPLVMALALFAFSGPALADPAPGILERPALAPQPGTQYAFEGYSRPHVLAATLREDFTIVLREIWRGGVSFQYSTEQKVLGDARGVLTLSSLDDCRSLDPWWDPDETDSDTRCELWIPRSLYMSLVASGFGHLAVDTIMRRDDPVRWELKGRTRYRCRENGHAVELPALIVHTARNDEFVILDDPDNPLILRAESTYFRWLLREVRH